MSDGTHNKKAPKTLVQKRGLSLVVSNRKLAPVIKGVSRVVVIKPV